MRIATTQYQALMNQSLQLNQGHLTQLTQKMATGRRIQVPSDHPVDSVRMSRLQREESTIRQYRDNIAAIKMRLTKNEGFLQNMVNDMIPGRDLLVWALDGSNTADDLKAMIAPLKTLRDGLFYNGNLVDQEGRYVFSGTMTATPPFTYNPLAAPGSRYTYTGNTEPQNVVVASGITQVGNENLMGLEALLNQLDRTIETMSAPGGADVNDPAVRSVLSANLDEFDAALQLVSSKIATMGGAQNILKTLDDNHANVSLSNQTAIAELDALDYSEAATELNGYQTALQATYKAYSKIGSLTLFSAI